MAARRQFRFYLVLAGLLPVLCIRPVSAQTPGVDSTQADSVRVHWDHTLPPLTVTAGRLPTTPANAPTRITVIDSAALARTGAASVAAALQQRAGLFVRQYGETGLATPALRGSGASQTALLLDGQPITDPQLGHLDLSLLPTILLRSVTVTHGPASPLHGSDALGGAIHLHTLRPQSSLQVRGSAHIGAFGERGGSVLVGGPVTDQTSVLAAADLQATDGDFPYVDESLFPSATVRRRNADRTRRSAFGSLRSEQGRHHLRLSGWVTHAERGLPPSSSTGPAQERQWDTQLRLWGRDRMRLGNGTLTVRGLTQHTRLRYADPRQGLDQTGRTWAHSLESTLRTPLSDHWTTAVGATGGLTRARHPKLDGDAHQEHLAAFAEGTGTYGRLRLYPAVRVDAYWLPKDDTRTPLSPRLGLNWQPVAAWPELRLKAHVARAFRVPTFNDRYWQPGGNPDLQPERSWGGDVGLRFDRPRGHAELTAFAQRRRDQIVWQPTGNGYWSPRNVRRVRAVGLEAGGEYTWPLPTDATLQTGLTYTVTDARNRTNPESSSYNEPLRYVPRTQIKPRATLAWGPAALTIQARYTSRRYTTSDGRQFLEAFFLTNTTLRVTPSFGQFDTALALDVDNLFDIDYESVGGRPMPPRHARIRLLVSP